MSRCNCCNNVATSNKFQNYQAEFLLHAAAELHEIGLSIDFKKGGEHGAYLLQNLNLPVLPVHKNTFLLNY